MKTLFVDIATNYNPTIFLVHFSVAVVLFFVVNWIGARSVSVGYMQLDVVIKEDSAPAFNFLFKVIAPVVFLILCIVIFQSLHIDHFVSNCYFIVVYYWLIRVLWTLMTSRRTLTNWGVQMFYWICSIALSLWVYSLVEKVDEILPDPRSLLDQLWILIIIFLYSILNRMTFSREGTIRRKDNYVKSRYSRFHKKYNEIIQAYFHNEFYETVTYAIMIYEDFNRPVIIRWIERVQFFITKRPHSLGIMQVVTDKYVDNRESIRLAMRKIAKDNNALLKATSKNYYDDFPCWLVREIAEKYNGGDTNYPRAIEEIYEYLVTTFHKEIPKTFPQIQIK